MQHASSKDARWLKATVIDVADGRNHAVLAELEPSASPDAGDSLELRR